MRIRHIELFAHGINFTGNTRPLAEGTLAGRHRTQSLRPCRSLALAHLLRQVLTARTGELADFSSTDFQNLLELSTRQLTLPEAVERVTRHAARSHLRRLRLRHIILCGQAKLTAQPTLFTQARSQSETLTTARNLAANDLLKFSLVAADFPAAARNFGVHLAQSLGDFVILSAAVGASILTLTSSQSLHGRGATLQKPIRLSQREGILKPLGVIEHQLFQARLGRDFARLSTGNQRIKHRVRVARKGSVCTLSIGALIDNLAHTPRQNGCGVNRCFRIRAQGTGSVGALHNVGHVQACTV